MRGTNMLSSPARAALYGSTRSETRRLRDGSPSGPPGPEGQSMAAVGQDQGPQQNGTQQQQTAQQQPAISNATLDDGNLNRERDSNGQPTNAPHPELQTPQPPAPAPTERDSEPLASGNNGSAAQTATDEQANRPNGQHGNGGDSYRHANNTKIDQQQAAQTANDQGPPLNPVQPPREVEHAAAHSTSARSAEHPPTHDSAAAHATALAALQAQLHLQQQQHQQELARMQEQANQMLRQQLQDAKDQLAAAQQLAQQQQLDAQARTTEDDEAAARRAAAANLAKQQLADRQRQLREPTDSELTAYKTQLKESAKPRWKINTINHLATRNKHAHAIATMSVDQWAEVLADPEQREFYNDHNLWLAKWLNLRLPRRRPSRRCELSGVRTTCSVT